MDSKLKTIFAVFVMFVLIASVAVVFLGIEIPSQQQKQSTQEKQQGLDNESSSLSVSKLTGLVYELENQGASFLEKSVTTTNESGVEEQNSESSYFLELNCDELSDIVSSFEDGWGKVLAEYNVRCEMDNVDDFLK